MRICKIKNCNDKVSAKGYCKKHYARVCRHNNPFHTKIEMHGMTKSIEYQVWKCIKNRCYIKTNKMYARYGGRMPVDPMGTENSKEHNWSREKL